MPKRAARKGIVARSKAQRAAGRKGKATPPAAAPPDRRGMNPSEILAARELFWHNVIREILTSLSTLCAMRPSEPEGPAEQAAAADAHAEGQQPAPEENGYDPTLFDGRLAVMTEGGERVAIADIYPLYGCGANAPAERGLSMALECTVFQIRTPDGHVFTLPLHEIRTFHAMTPELMHRLERAAQRRREGRAAGEEQAPFGFAAFTSTLQATPRLPEPAPSYPLE